jgi:hypothetical protein
MRTYKQLSGGIFGDVVVRAAAESACQIRKYQANLATYALENCNDY